jgi:hypothetical protein
MLLTLGEKSSNLNLGAIVFQREVELSIKFGDGNPAINRVGFLSDILYLS